MVVLLGHCSLVYVVPDDARRAIDVVLNQRAAVLIFFVLSGYVLALSWMRMRAQPRALTFYYIRRALRLMPALWAATAIALVLVHLFPFPSGRTDFSAWFAAGYVQVGWFREAKAFFAFDNGLIPPTWTITVEIIGSILVPLIVTVMARGRGTALAVVAPLVLVTLLVGELLSRLSMAAFIVQFAAGCGLALYFTPARARPFLLGGLGMALIFLARPLFWFAMTGAVQPVEYRTDAAAPALLETVGAVMLVAALASGHLRLAMFEWRLMKRLGDWSYSIYLIHFPVMRLVAYALPQMPTVAAVVTLTILTLAITLALSALVFRYIEQPGIALGKLLTRPGLAPARAAP